MTPQDYITILQQAVLGGAVGYGTNYIAIKLLFQPYRKVKFGPLSFGPGVFVRHQEKLAREVSRIAAQSILTVDALRSKLDSPQLRTYFYSKLNEFITQKLDEEYGPLPGLFPDELQRDYRELVLYTRGRLRDATRNYVQSEPFAEVVGGVVADTIEYFAKKRIGDVVGERELANLTSVAQNLLVARLSDGSAASDLHAFTDGIIKSFFADTRPLREILPARTAQEISARLKPFLHESLAQASRTVDLAPLTDAVRSLLARYVEEFIRPKDSGFFKNIVNETFSLIKGRDLERALEKFTQILPDWLREYMRSDEGVTQATELASRAIESLLEISPAKIGEELGEEAMIRLRDYVADVAMTLLTSKQVSEVIAEYISVSLEGLGENTLEDALRSAGVTDQRESYRSVGRFIVERLREPEAVNRLLARVSTVFRTLLEKPIGRPSRFINDRARDAIAGLINQTMFDYLALHSAQLIASLEFEEVIYRKVANWEPRELHRMVELAARDNLRSLEILGGIIGLVVGALFGLIKVLS